MSVAVTMNDPSNAGVKAATGNSSLTGSNAADLQSSFLTLLVAQLKNQDPTNPLQNNELTTQLAQISTVSGIEKLNTTLGSISGQIDNSQSLQASTLIGHNGGTQLVAQPLQFALVQGVIRSNGGNTLDLGTYGTTTLDEVRQII